jgi:hypothetical protein
VPHLGLPGHELVEAPVIHPPSLLELGEEWLNRAEGAEVVVDRQRLQVSMHPPSWDLVLAAKHPVEIVRRRVGAPGRLGVELELKRLLAVGRDRDDGRVDAEGPVPLAPEVPDLGPVDPIAWSAVGALDAFQPGEEPINRPHVRLTIRQDV